LVQLTAVDAQNRSGYLSSTAIDLIDQAGIFEGVCGFLTPQSTIEIGGEVRPIAALAVSGRCFDVLGVRPAAGRLIGPPDEIPGAPNVAVLSYDFWQTRFGGAPDVIGRTISIEGDPVAIVGVVERRFTGLQVGFPSHVFVPLRPRTFLPASLRNIPLSANVFARLPGAASSTAAFERLQSIWPDVRRQSVPIAAQGPQRTAWLETRVQMTSAATGLDSLVRTRFHTPLLALMAIAMIVLATASINVAGVLVTTTIERRREYAVRAALGASRLRLVRQAAIETLVLLVPAVALGAWLSYSVVQLLLSIYASTSRNFGLDAAPDVRVLIFVIGIASVAWLLFAIGPLVIVGRTPPGLIAADGAFGNTKRRSRTGRGLVAAEISLSLLLVTCAAWFAGSLRELRAAPRGWTAEGLLTTRLAAIPGGYAGAFEPAAYYRGLLERVAALPGVRAAALTHVAPPIASAFFRERVIAVAERERSADPIAVRVSDGFFAAVQLPLAAGVEFARFDGPSQSRTAVVSESLALQLFDTRAPLGRHVVVRHRSGDQIVRIVGVAADATIGDPRAGSEPAIYLNYWQQEPGYQQSPALLVRSDAALEAVAAAVRTEIATSGREYALGMSPAIDQVEARLVQERLMSVTAILFAVIGLFLAVVGVFGLVSITVVSRTKELGIRLAIGATRREVMRLVMRDTLVCLACGVAGGIPLVIASARLLASLVYGQTVYRASAITVTVLLVVTASLVAAWLPARRAARIDPLSALRLE
jgi:predicted permease